MLSMSNISSGSQDFAKIFSLERWGITLLWNTTVVFMNKRKQNKTTTKLEDTHQHLKVISLGYCESFDFFLLHNK